MKPGTIVTVGPAYRMGGQYVADGTEGVYTVLRPMADARGDYYLTCGAVSVAGLSEADWDVIVNEARITVEVMS